MTNENPRGLPGVAESVEEKLWASVVKEPGGCWIWQGSTGGSNGYGRFRYRGKAYYAHRLSYALHNGEIPPGMYVCHRCDTPSCVNPAHLFLGTPTENAADMYAKGRNPPGGQEHATSKLTDDEVYAIRADGRTYPEIARDYGISPSNVRQVQCRITWKHLPETGGRRE